MQHSGISFMGYKYKRLSEFITMLRRKRWCLLTQNIFLTSLAPTHPYHAGSLHSKETPPRL